MMNMGGAPQMIVLSKYFTTRTVFQVLKLLPLLPGENTKRESGRKVQLDNVRAAKSVADIIRTCLGPRAMLKVIKSFAAI